MLFRIAFPGPVARWWIPLAITATAPVAFTAAVFAAGGEDAGPGGWTLIPPLFMLLAFFSALVIAVSRYVRSAQPRPKSILLEGIGVGCLCAVISPLVSIAAVYATAWTLYFLFHPLG